MARRPIFVPSIGPALVREIPLDLVWSPGFAVVQKRRNVKALHEAARAAGYSPVLEVSTKSEEKVGQHLSAFHLKVRTESLGDIPLECAFQGSKVFNRGGPYTDLYSADVRAAKRDPRLLQSGGLAGFRFEEHSFPLEPKTVFYDWLYINAIFPHRDWLKARLHRYSAFSDIEFNPQRSVNCQARSCALFVALMRTDALSEAIISPAAFVAFMRNDSPAVHQPMAATQNALFPR